jgi:hypothetical protein
VTRPGGSASKLTDRHLLDLLAAGSEEPIPVLVEVVGPRPRVEFGIPESGGSPRPRSVAPPAASGTTLSQGARTVETLLHEVTGQPPTWLAAASSFSALATPHQVEVIATSADVRAIFLNRRVAG